MVYPTRKASIVNRIMKRRTQRRTKFRLSNHDLPKVASRKKRSEKSDSLLSKIDPNQTYWYRCYVEYPAIHNNDFNSKFRLRFRLPYSSFKALLHDIMNCDIFHQWNKASSKSPIELLILGSLRYLGRGWVFDDIEEATGIGKETHRQFFHKFILYGSTNLYSRYVNYPKKSSEAQTHQREYEVAGMHGAIGSMDACHVIIEKCCTRLKQNHLGGKSKLTCRSYNLTCNHRRQILHTTPGSPARWNDKTIILFDKFALDLQKGRILNDNVFELYQTNEHGEIISVKYCGAWLLVDNGYLKWATTIPPCKNTIFYEETRWSEWLESMRKDVECTFGILKGRWRILKAGVRLQGVDSCDKIWKTCCALHNLLLDVDGLSEHWDGELGVFDSYAFGDSMPFALTRLSNPLVRRQYDTSGMGAASHLTNEYESDEDSFDDNISNCSNIDEEEDAMSNNNMNSAEDDVNYVHNLSQEIFQKRLIEHFDILFKNNKIKWPRAK